MLRYLSVCSGVESASVAWEHLGWTPVGFSEIEPFPSAVLKHRFPNVPNFGDMTKYKEWPIEPGTVDVLVGGTPCQSFSVAGLRKGLDDPRGNLMLVYLGLAEHFRVPWLVWENVPGVLSSNGGRDFGTFLGALGELGYRWSFRVLDAQYFGVPQRRRRVFVIAHLGDRGDPAKVLFEPESLRGDTAKSGKARKGSPRGARPGAESGGRPGPFWNGADVAEALTRTSDDQRMPDKGRMQMVVQPYRMTAFGQYEDDDGASTCSRRDHKDATDLVVTATGSHWDHPANPHPTLSLVSDGALGMNNQALFAQRGACLVPAVTATGPVTHYLKGEGFDGGEDGTGRGTPIVPAIAFHPTPLGDSLDPISSVEVTHAMGTGSRQGTATVAVAIPFDTTQMTSPKNYSSPKPGDPCHPLAAGAHPPAIAFAQNTRDEVRLISGDGQTVGALAAQPGMKQTTYLAMTIPLQDGRDLDKKQNGLGVGSIGDPAYTLDTLGQQAVATVTGTLSSRATAGGGLGTDFEVAGGLQPTITDARGIGNGCVSPTLRAKETLNDYTPLCTQPTMAVRRLLPVETERLQGFPDNWTDIYRKKATPDGPRYKAMGNSMAVPVMRWIGERLDRVVRGGL